MGNGKSTRGAGCCGQRAAMSRAPAPPDRNDEYAFYQLLLGSWPAELICVGEFGSGGSRPIRSVSLRRWKVAARAKLHTTWAAPDEEI